MAHRECASSAGMSGHDAVSTAVFCTIERLISDVAEFGRAVVLRVLPEFLFVFVVVLVTVVVASSHQRHAHVHVGLMSMHCCVA